MEEKRIIDSEVLKKVSGGAAEEEYYAEYEKFGLIDSSRAHAPSITRSV